MLLFYHCSLSLTVSLLGNVILNLGVTCRGIALGSRSRLDGILPKCCSFLFFSSASLFNHFFVFSHKTFVRLFPKI